MPSTFVRSLLLVTIATAVGCTQSTASIVEILVDPPSATINLGQNQPFTATAEYEDGDAVDVTAQVTWTSSDEEVATIDRDGLATPVRGGVTIITAVFGEHRGAAELTVEQEPVLVSCTVEPSTVTLTIGGTEQLVVMGHHDDGSTEDVTDAAVFESSDRTVAIVDSQGEVVAIGVGESDVEASIDDLACTPATITVVDVPCTELTITADGSEVFVDHSFQLTATCAFGDDTIDENNQVEWSSSDAAIATVDYEGVAMGVSEGDTTITAVFTNSGGSTVVATFDLTVIPAALESISVSPVTATGLGVGDTQHFTATCVYEGGSTYDCTTDVIWASSDEAVATISNSAGSEGQATSVDEGATEITVEMDGITSNIAVLLVEVPVTCVSIAITPTDPVLCLDLVLDFSATCTMSDGTVEVDPAGLTWESSNTRVATIDSDGLATGWTVGTTNITASLAIGSGPVVSPVSLLTVPEGSLESIEVTPNPLNLVAGVSASLTAAALVGCGVTLDVTAMGTWSTEDGSVATVSNAAGSEGEVTAHAPGATKISINYMGVVGTGDVFVF